MLMTICVICSTAIPAIKNTSTSYPVDSDNIRGKSSQYLVRCANNDREMIEDFAALPHKPVLMLLASYEISDGSGGSSATHVSKRKSNGEEDNDVEDQLSVKKKQGQKKIKGE
ncbi:hypothetical protein DY000_02058965 [Brassica cretica]|uniref:Uncharacterized protein n=1 Tax=Brassica cretica TaxID=69181 RepID=A0ABQ7AWP5_BRACR|nr:hypothetical protein DY000_02058965 [Brassica cretica]